MTNRVQTLRSSVTTNLPPAGVSPPGVLWTNFPDLQFGVIDTAKNPQKLLAVRFFSTTGTYAAGDIVVNAGVIYTALGAISPGAFNAGQWQKNAQLTDIPAPYVLPTASTTVLGGVKVDGVTVLIDGTGKISSIGTVFMGAAPPGAPIAGNLWWDSIGGQLYVYYDDGNTRQWVVAVNENLSTNYLPLIGGTLSGSLGITAAYPQFTLNKTAAGNPAYLVGQNNGLNRWALSLGDGAAESGGNVGTDFYLQSFDDTGTWNFNVMRAQRVNGNVTFAGAVSAGGALSSGGNLTVTGNINLSGQVSASGQIYSGTNMVANSAMFPAYGFSTTFVLNADATYRNLMWRNDYYMQWSNSTGTLNWVHNNISVMTLDSPGNLVVHGNINGANGVYSAQVNAAQFSASSNLGYNCAPASGYWYALSHDANALYINVNGGAGRYILFTAGSDERIKDVSGPSPYGLREILATEPVLFTYKGNHAFPAADGNMPALNKDMPEAPLDTETVHVGVSAQKQELIIPEMIGRRAGFIDGEPVDDLRAFVKHEWIIYALVNAVKELNSRIEQLEAGAR